jgi:hypothetical protein
MKLRALAAGALLAGLWVAPSAAQTGCTSQTLNVRGTPVTIGYCLRGAPHSDGAGEVVVPVTATYTAPGGGFSQSRDLHFIAGENVSRILDKLRLERLGMRGTLHLTLSYAGGVVRVDGALLTPGGITIK